MLNNALLPQWQHKQKPSGNNQNCRGTGTDKFRRRKKERKKVSVAAQTVQLHDGWVSEPDTEQPMNEQENVNNILARLCALSRPYSKPKSPTHEAQAAEPPVPFETAKKKKRRGKKHKDKGASFGYM